MILFIYTGINKNPFISVYDLIVNTDKWEPAGVYKIIKKAIEVKR